MVDEVLIIRNTPREGPGLLEEILKEKAIKYTILDWDGKQTPPSLKDYKALVVLGGPDSANDDNDKIKNELILVRQALNENMPYLGICLGLQILVKAAGGEVIKSPVKEIGLRDRDNQYFQVSLTQRGRQDDLFNGLDASLPVFHLHGETVEITKDMELLAEGKYCRNQIVKVGHNADGTQGHFEVTTEMLEYWTQEDPDLTTLDTELLKKDFASLQDSYTQTGRQLFENFLKIAGF
jgi:GMP synthase (glutamine-hydrolysing)